MIDITKLFSNLTVKSYPTFTYNGLVLTDTSLKAFELSVKGNNDNNNKIRESIIGAIINDKVPEEYYSLEEWASLKREIFIYLGALTPQPHSGKVECVHMGGRKFNFDFSIKIDDIVFKIELKYNAESVNNVPQFASPMKPSKYLSESFEEHHYSEYLPKIALLGGFEMPVKEDYLKQIHSNKPKCMELFQLKYYQGCSLSSQFTGDPESIKFYLECNEISRESISTFIEKADLDINILSDYLAESQKDKIYMLYFNGRFIKQIVNPDDYRIKSCIRHKNTYICTTYSDKTMKVLLRWKNGNSIAYPAFQIK